MGSTNTGRFSDYPGGRPRSAPGRGRESPGQSGGDSRCLVPVEDQLLEEVERCEYFATHQDVPPTGTDIVLLEHLQGGRLAIAIAASGEVIGYLPTSLNYLRACMAHGWRYHGEVVAVLREHIALIRVDLRARG